ncbi:uncharacterized protein MYCFIDRAFT_75632 [Pseudocercospora fijiensis CIRAD86]|uniref:Uncharacterized protein n=1 Tax=Pseudocercospora fijiensis (strain CIRAD86) TaxID=383855 RepID=N1QA67_PSEFD|nr:uncharacterized protein MYCFIDRAFT_75632 [Pseudocercospora fijiensis CIRAD86]EME87798.1 hypothetical protein MYCFIDRAFT_75632 [Pseudocercospora fijiensis CIRAD86]
MGNCIGSPNGGAETAQARNADLEKAEQETEILKTRNVSLEHENAELRQRNSDLQHRCEALEAEYQKRLAERDAQARKHDEDRQKQANDLILLSTERDGARDAVQQLERRIAELQTRNEVLALQLESTRADAAILTKNEMSRLRDDLVHESQRNMAELLERMNAIRDAALEELAQAKATAAVESAAAREAASALERLKAAAEQQHEEDSLKLAATLKKLSHCEAQYDESRTNHVSTQAALDASQAQLSKLSQELETTRAALSNANASYGWNISDVDWTERDYHDNPYKFSHRTTRKDFTVSYKWWDASNDYCVDIREWYYNTKSSRMERTTKGVFLPLPTAQELSRILPEVVRQAKVVQLLEGIDSHSRIFEVTGQIFSGSSNTMLYHARQQPFLTRA